MVNGSIDDRIRRDVFGHRLTTEVYGDGASLEHTTEVLSKIAF